MLVVVAAAAVVVSYLMDIVDILVFAVAIALDSKLTLLVG